MSFSGWLAYRTLKVTMFLFPFMKTKITDLEKELEKSKKINEQNKFVFPTDRKALYKEIKVGGYPLDKRYGFVANTIFKIVDETKKCQMIEITFC